VEEVIGVVEVVGAKGVPASVRRSRRMRAGGWANMNRVWREDMDGQPNMGVCSRGLVRVMFLAKAPIFNYGALLELL
jgi:hypothetical protein